MADNLWSWHFWKDAIERAIRAAANTVVGLMVVNNVPIRGHLDWPGMTTAAGVAALASILTSVAASGATGSPNASIVEVKGDIPPTNKIA